MYQKDQYKKIYLECLKEQKTWSEKNMPKYFMVLFCFFNGKRSWCGEGAVKLNKMKLREIVLRE